MRRYEDGDETWEVFDEARDENIEVDVEYTICFGAPEYIPSRDRPDLYSPPEADEIKISSITFEGKPYELSEEETEKLEKWILEHCHD